MKITFLVLIFITILHAESKHEYHLNTFIQQALNAAFSLKEDDAKIHYEKQNVLASTLWKNPEIELEFSNALKRTIDYSYIEIAQQLPAYNEHTYKQLKAQSILQQAHHAKELTVLQVQYHAATLFQKLYFLSKEHRVLQQQIEHAGKLKRIAVARENAGDISGLDRSRIAIVQQQLHMQQESLELRTLTLQLQAQSLLKISDTIIVTTTPALPKIQESNITMAMLEQNPSYRFYDAQHAASRHELQRIKTQRYLLPEIHFYQERNAESEGHVQNNYGFGIRATIPLWNRQNNAIEMQRAIILKNSTQQNATTYQLKRNIQARFKLYKKSLRQLQAYQTRLLEPSKTLYEITTRSFELGEKSLLELIDAQTLYFQNQLDCLTLQVQSSQYKLQLLNDAAVDLLKDYK